MPRMPAILVSPCCKANRGNGATPNFSGDILNMPMLKSLIFAALIRFDASRPNCAEIRVGSAASPSDLTKPSCKMVTNAPVSSTRRVDWPRIEHGTVNAPRTRRVRETTYPPGQVLLRKGEEMGRFMLGSTVVLLFTEKAGLAFNPLWEPGRAIRLGEAMASVRARAVSSDSR